MLELYSYALNYLITTIRLTYDPLILGCRELSLWLRDSKWYSYLLYWLDEGEVKVSHSLTVLYDAMNDLILAQVDEASQIQDSDLREPLREAKELT